jgi:AcrR family transcriptional regulator
MSTAADRPLRRDAERNRQRILAAAAEVFARRGLEVTMDDIADHAGVGVGTVYRRFPNKELLIEAVFEDHLAQLAATLEQALAEDDPWEALVGAIERIQAQQAANWGLKDLVLSTQHGRERVTEVRERLAPLGDALVARAQAAGLLRGDLVGTDLALVNVAIGAIADFAGEVSPEAWRRMLAIVVDGLRARDDLTPMPAPPLEREQLDGAMRAWRPPRREPSQPSVRAR